MVLTWASTIGQFVIRHRRKISTTYLLTNLRARADTGSRTFETAVGDRHFIWWSRDRTHVTVVWAEPRAVALGSFTPLRQGRRVVAFADVADGVALVKALGEN